MKRMTDGERIAHHFNFRMKSFMEDYPDALILSLYLCPYDGCRLHVANEWAAANGFIPETASEIHEHGEVIHYVWKAHGMSITACHNAS